MQGVLLLFISLLAEGGGFNMARIYKSTGGFLTSSTLEWKEVSAGKPIPPNAVRVEEGGPFWCTVEESGVSVPGAVVNGSCRAPFFNVIEKPHFEVLVSINGSSRLKGQSWDQEAIPINAIAKDRFVLAYIKSDNETLVGNVHTEGSTKRAYFIKDAKVIDKTKGVILTEDEPKEYSLGHIEFAENKSDLIEVTEIFSFENHDPTTKNLSHKVNFVDEHIAYWRNCPGCIQGLNTTIVTPNNTYQVKWGVKTPVKRDDRYHLIEYTLPPHSYINVTVFQKVAQMSDMPYTGTLESIYGDSIVLSRKITGIHDSKRFVELQANFSSIYSLEDDEPMENSRPQTKTLFTTPTASPPHADEDEPNKAETFNAVLLVTSAALMMSFFFIKNEYY